MSEPEYDKQLGKLFKSEADERLFDDLHFDQQMRSRVREALRETDSKTRIKRPGKIWLYSASVAVIAATIVMAVIGLPDEREVTIAGDPPIEFMGGIEMSPLGGDVVGTLSATEPVILQSYDEAVNWFGENVNVPSYVPEHYKLLQFQAYNGKEGSAAKIVLIYEDDHGSRFNVSESKIELDQKVDEYDTINVGGIEAQSYQDQELSNVEIYWTFGSRYYSITGSISTDDAIQIAQSIISK